ncbi:MAG: hypothetical protein ACRDJJ_07585 [Actinomycetota bacterium]
MDNAELVRRFLRAQNLEQVGRVEEAVDLYESAVAEGFDASGPYDRLIAIYASRALHGEVVRVATFALEAVRSHEGKRDWYRRMRADAEKAAAAVPRPAPRKR